jgi:TrmH family RNA methyltransferase
MKREGPFWIDRGDAPSKENVRFVLVGTTEPGNIGAAARGMKAMGFRRLVLVAPADGWKTPHAVAMAHGAEDLLEKAEIHESLDEALRGCTWVVGTTRRLRRHQAKTVTAREWGARLARIPRSEEIAILFGPEKTGLENEDVLRCRLIVTIPSPIDYPSLNLAQATMLMAYESGLALREPANRVGSPALASDDEMERVYARMEEALRESRMNEMKVRAMMKHLRVILARAELSKDDASTFHTLASRIRGPRPREKKARAGE